MSAEALEREIHVAMGQFVGRTINDSLFDDIRWAILCKTGKQVWCDGALNPPSITARGNVRAVYLTPDDDVATITLTGEAA